MIIIVLYLTAQIFTDDYCGNLKKHRTFTTEVSKALAEGLNSDKWPGKKQGSNKYEI